MVVRGFKTRSRAIFKFPQCSFYSVNFDRLFLPHPLQSLLIIIESMSLDAVQLGVDCEHAQHPIDGRIV